MISSVRITIFLLFFVFLSSFLFFPCVHIYIYSFQASTFGHDFWRGLEHDVGDRRNGGHDGQLQ